MRNVLLIFLLFFSEFAFSSVSQFGTQDQARAACQATGLSCVIRNYTDVGACYKSSDGRRFCFSLGCPSGMSPDPVTGECVAAQNLCEDKAGETFTSNAPLAVLGSTAYSTNGASGNLPQTACNSGCEASLSQYYSIGSGSLQGVYTYSGEECSGSGSGSGSGGSGGGTGSPPPDIIDDPAQQPDPTKSSSSTQNSPDGTKTDNSSSTTKVNHPDGGDIETTVDTKKTTSPDGSSTTDTTTTTKTTDKDGNETTTVRTDTETCDSAGQCSTATTYTGTSTSNEDETDTSDSAVAGGESCDAMPACEGDAIQCATLRQQWQTRCNSDYVSDAIGDGCSSSFQCEGDPIACALNLYQHNNACAIQEQLTSQTIEEAIDNGLDSLEDDLGGSVLDDEGKLIGFDEEIDISEEVDLSSVFNQSSSRGGGSCPEAQSISLSFGSYEVQFEPLCDLATQVAPLIVLIFSLIGGRIIFGAVIE